MKPTPPTYLERYHGWDLFVSFGCYYAGGCPASRPSLEALKAFVDANLEIDINDNKTGKRK